MKKAVKLTGILILVVFLLSGIQFNAFSLTSGSIGTGIKQSVILYVGSPVAYVNGSEKRIDPDNLEVVPIIKNNTVMVPVRFIAESLGGSAVWDQKGKTATIVLGGKSYKFTQGSSMIVSGTDRYSAGAPVQAYKGRTLVPLNRFVEIVGRKAIYERGLIIISGSSIPFDKDKDKALISEWIGKLSYLPVVGSREKLMSLLEDQMKKGPMILYGGIMRNGAANMVLDSGAAQSAAKTAEAPAPSSPVNAAAQDTGKMKSDEGDYSTTNVQVQGVDEGDVVKTDGDYIYQVNRERVVIVKADPAESMKVTGIISFTGKNMYPREIYLQGQKLVVIGDSQSSFPLYKEGNGVKKEIYPSRRYTQGSTKILIYDISDKSNARLLREFELEGSYVSSRKVGSALYAVANDYADYYRIQNSEINSTPSYKDSVLKTGYKNVDYKSICYFPGAVEANYMMVAGINIDSNEAANVSTYLGAGQNIYASTENLYVSVTSYSNTATSDTAAPTTTAPGTAAPNTGVVMVKPGMPVNSYQVNTEVYKFAMKDSKATYLCKGSVPGTILNQFSMDEQGGTFRIATTRGDTWAENENISKNALYVLDSMLSIKGKIDDMAPGERIYSVRFMGDRAYVVTFKTVDPLFVIDLKDPAKPVILGALKIPGYSDYLHPYDENHIIGFGKDTTEIKGQAYYQGMKLAMFDVSDVSKPVQMFSEMIGVRGTDSELLHNHKALLFSKEKNLLAFPVTLMERKDSSDKVKSDSLEYGQFTFQGAYVYSLDLKNGFKLKGRITHLSADDYLKSGNSWYQSDKNVQRIIYIGDRLYTLSNNMIKANAMSDLKEKGSVLIPQGN